MEKKKILIVEDEVILCNVLYDKLIREGFIALKAGDGKEGIEVALREHPDLILLDIIMPVMDGITALKKLREDEWGKDVKIIILSNLNDNERVAEAMSQGTYDFFVKSDWNLEDVVIKIRKMIE
ncbi:response regulator [Patescibacteria group bacterium]|nr:response regulator [Patescibacteria group bacterium]MBU0879271.1 response regulator [Patescibacteria group bacterium]MBU0880167.1 response regulator [Patescibacteria group bacterium]MBU1062916.1 response regulator [Patescibacteria group bacterium]MBU1783536.1 response regulator [Patescibacteria group bacterium]